MLFSPNSDQTFLEFSIVMKNLVFCSSCAWVSRDARLCPLAVVIIGVPSYHFEEIADMNCYSLDIFFFLPRPFSANLRDGFA